MPGVFMLMKDFAQSVKPTGIFLENPRMSFYDAFDEMKRNLPPGGTIMFMKCPSGVLVDICPFAGPGPTGQSVSTEEPTNLRYQIFPEFSSAVIWRIKGYRHKAFLNPAELQPSGVGAALFASQYPFWQKIGIESLAVSWTSSEGFYKKMGFETVDHLPELPDRQPPYYNLMRLDFNNPAQNARFQHAIRKSRPFSAINLAL